ncbi:MAG: nucleotide exchange factor GrpE, partial [Candidatus Izemoplasmataceae bacterium]
MTKKKKETDILEEEKETFNQEERLNEASGNIEDDLKDSENAQEDEKSEIDSLKEEVQSLKDQLLRNQAELQNFKRRMNEERIKDRIFANVELIKKLITPLDN